MGKIKNMLKHILPPPVDAFNREIDSLRKLILDQNITQMEKMSALEAKIEGKISHVEQRVNDANVSAQRVEKGLIRSLPMPYLTNFVLNICDHCNLRCKGCDHFACIAEERFVPLESIRNDVFRMAELTGGRVDYIGIMGGEPLLHPDLIEIMSTARKALPKTRIRIVTNGILLLNMSEDFWDCCRDNDIVVVNTKYPIDLKYEQIQEVAAEHGVQFEFYGSTGTYEKTLFKWPLDITGRQDPCESFWKCFRVHSCMFVSDGKFYPCTVAPNILHFNKKFGSNLELTEKDYLDIYQVQDVSEILEFLDRPIPFCRYCMADKCRSGYAWERSRQEMSEWTLNE